MTEKINVTLVDLLESKKLELDLPFNVPILELLPDLASKMEVPAQVPCFIGWLNRVLPDNETLGDAGVWTGTTLHLLFSHDNHVLVEVDDVWIVELPATVPLSCFGPVLASKIGLSKHAIDLMQHLPSQRLLTGDNSLSDVDVREGDALKILSDVTDIGYVSPTEESLVTVYYRILLEDSSSQKKVVVAVPVDEPMIRLLPELVARMQMADSLPRLMQHVSSGRFLREYEDLSDVGVKEGDRFCLLPGISDLGTIATDSEDSIMLYRRVTVTDALQGQTVLVELPTEESVKCFLPALAAKMGLPSDAEYAIQLGISGRLVQGEETLGEAGIKEGDSLHLLCDPNGSPLSKMELTVSDLILDPTDKPSSKTTVTVIDQAGGKVMRAELPINAPMSRLLPALVAKMQLPPNVQYGIQHKQSGKQLQNTDTLSGASVEDDDTLQLMANITAGGYAGGFVSLFGISFPPLPIRSYRCNVGPHLVTVEAVVQRDATGRPLCPEHHTVMTIVRSIEEET